MLFQELKISGDYSLQAAAISHAPALFKTVTRERTFLEPWLEWTQQIQTVAHCELAIKEMALFNQGGQKFFSFLIYKHQLVGSIALVRIDPNNQKGELGFWKSSQFVSKPLMQQACNQLIKKSFENLDLHRLELKTLSKNIAAQQLAIRLGFIHEGTLKEAVKKQGVFEDLAIYGLIKP